jgi:gas vesicle protein
MRKDNISGTVFTFVLGLGIGAAAALLFAPKAGEELRTDIADGASDGIDQIHAASKGLRRKGQKLVNMAKDQATEAIDAASSVYNQVTRT